MSNANITLTIVANNLAGSAFGGLFANLTTLAVLGGSAGNALANGLTPMMGLAAAAVGAGVAFGLFSDGLERAMDDAAQLEWELARLQNATGATDEQFAGMRQSVQDVAGSSVFSSAEVAQAYTIMANNLIPVDRIIGGMGQKAIILSEAMGTDAVSGSKLLTQAFKDFSDQGLTDQQMIDMLTRAFHDGMPDVAGMSSMLARAGGQADSMGVSMRDLLAVADVLSPAMGSVAQAGSSLNYMLKGITDPTSAAATEFQKLGLIVGNRNYFYDAQGNFIGLANAIDLIKKSLDGMTTQERADALDKLFNVKSGMGAKILTNLKDFKGEYDKIFADLGQPGSANEAADRLVGTWQGRLNELKTNITSLFANAGQTVNDTLKPALTWLGDFVDKLAHDKGFDAFLGRLLLVGTAVAGLTLAAIGLGLAIATLGPLLAIAGAVFAGIVAFSAEVAAAWTLMTTKGNAVHDAVHGLLTVLGGLKDWLGQVWSAAQPWLQSLKDIAQMAGDNLKQSLQQLMDALGKIKDSIPQQEWDTFLGALKAVALFVGGTLLVVLVGLAVGVVAAFSVAITFLAGLVSTIVSLGTLIIRTLGTIGLVIDDLKSGHLDRAKADWAAGWAQMQTDAQNFGTQFANMVQNTGNAMDTAGKMATAIGTSMGDGLYNGFINSMNAHYDGYKRSADQVAYTLSRSLKFQSPPKEGPLSDSDQWGGRYIDLLVAGMNRGLGTLRDASTRVAGTMGFTPGAQAAVAATFAPAGPVGGNGTITVPVYLDGKQIASTTFDVLKGQLKAMGMSRLYK